MDIAALIEYLDRSRLVPDAALAAAVKRCGPAAGAAALLDALVHDRALTEFQARRLACGESKGLVLGAYRLLDDVGVGGMGHVYKALHVVMERVVALKVILPELTRHVSVRELFRREVRALTQLQHGNVVMAFDAGEEDDICYLVMEYVEGLGLDALVRSRGPLPIAAACELICQAARGLRYAHERGMVHRDVKPANLLVLHWFADELAAERPAHPKTDTPLPAVKVVDFGLARLQGAADGQTVFGQSGSVVGTPDYMAPEQARDVRAADERSDLYSLGCTLYFALTGRTPFGGALAVEKALKHLTEEAPPVQELRPDVPNQLAGIVRWLLSKNPLHRPQNATDLLNELTPWTKAEATANVNLPAEPAAPENVRQPEPLTPPSPAPPAPVAREDVGQKPRPRSSATMIVPPPESIERPAPAQPSEWVVHIPTDKGNVQTDSKLVPGVIQPALRRDWRQWTAIIESLSRRGTARLSEAQYRTLHSRLVATCREHAYAAGAPWSSFFESLAKLVEPWLSLRAMSQTEVALLQTLLERCHAADRYLRRSAAPFVYRTVALFVLALVAAWMWHDRLAQPLLRWLQLQLTRGDMPGRFIGNLGVPALAFGAVVTACLILYALLRPSRT